MTTSKKIIYLDQAATSFPKASPVMEAVSNFLLNIGANPGRSAHSLSIKAAHILYEARRSIAEFIGASDSRNVIFMQNATMALNLALLGFLKVNDEVVITSMEHNSVMRPLRSLEQERHIVIKRVRANAQGYVSPDEVANTVSKKTRLVVVNHVSNVTGTIQPLTQIRDAAGYIPLLVDAAQSAGHIPLNVEQDGIDMLAFSGHKGLLGPPGTGVLYVRPGFEIEPLITGGTGSGSESIEQPDFMPDRFESGTQNSCGIAGLGAAVRWLMEQGIDSIRKTEHRYAVQLYEGLSVIKGLTLYGPELTDDRLPIFAFTIKEIPIHEIALRLDRDFGIMVRVGLQCAPEAHRTIGTFPTGTVRLSAGHLNTAEEIDYAIKAIRNVASGK